MTGPHRAYMTALLNLVKSYHVDAGTVLKGTVINPDEKITPRALSKICERAIRLTGDPALGLRYGTQVNVNNHGIVGYALMSSRTVGRAVDLLLKYNNVLAPGIEVERVTEKDECRIQCTPRRPSDLSRFFVEAFMGSLVTSLKDLLGDDASSLRVEFAGDPPVGSVDYAELASVPVRFKQSNNAVIFDASVLDLELSNASSVMASVCERHCEGLLRTLNWNHGLAGQVRERLLHSMADFPSVAEMARSLSMSERTLRRRLRAEDTGYQEILNEVRGHLAKEYLTTTELPVADIAILLGFDESANFRRAFKQWTGQPPGAYRKSELRPN